MTSLDQIDLTELGESLKQRGLDGWLVYDFHDINPIARRVLGISGMLTRRIFVWLPAVGAPRAVVHSIDRHLFAEFPGELAVYTTWQDLHQRLTELVRGRRIAMEVSPENAVPYLDLVPAGVVELLKRLGGSLVPSAPLVTQFAARWSASELADHRTTAEALANIARDTLSRVVREPGRANESAVQREVLDAMTAAGLGTDDPPIVAFGARAANPHHEPQGGAAGTLRPNDVVLLDLWARRSEDTVWADQTWMAFAGSTPPQDVVRVWEAVRDARDAVVARLSTASAAGESLSGAVLDQTARQVIGARGYGDAFVHRTGHSIDLDLHGSGPHLDDFETHDIRELLPGVAFSVEPGIYLEDRFGMRSEINVVLTSSGPEVTPVEPQRELILAD